MKTYSNLFDKICTYNNFRKAYKNAIKGKSHYKEVKAIQRNPPRYIHNLLNEVKNKTYEVSGYKIFNLYTGHKWREIYKLPMRDRIVQHAIMIYLEPIFRENFIQDTYSSIKTRGIHLGLSRVKRALKKHNYTYYLQLDIHKCYPSIDKDILKSKLKDKFKDDDLCWLLFTIIDSCEHGVPIGNYTSQYFNNFYFSTFDHWIKEVKQRKAYFRYCDDIIILGDTKEELHSLLKEIIVEINKLNVKIKKNRQIYKIDTKGINFLGYIIKPNYVKIRKHTKQNFISKINCMNLNNLTKRDINVLGSYWGILKHADCRNLWFKYTKVKQFKDLNISVHNRDFVKDILCIPIVITRSIIFQKRGQEWLKFECSYCTNDAEGNSIEHKDIYVSTSAEMLVEAGKQFTPDKLPFETTIVLNEKGFYQFK